MLDKVFFLFTLLSVKMVQAQANMPPVRFSPYLETEEPSPSDLPIQYGGGGIELVNPLGTYSIQELLNRIIYYLHLLAAPIVVIMILWGAFLLIASAGDKEKIQRGRKTIMWAIIGYGILLIASGVNFIIQQLLYGW